MADNKKMVEQITDMDQDFTQWYTDVCTKADLIAYSHIKGFMVIKPYGYAIWENIQALLDKRFKATGVENVYMPLLIPESLLAKEGELVNGFAPEVAWVTAGGTEPLTERLAIRPTSETVFSDFYKDDVHSYRDLSCVGRRRLVLSSVPENSSGRKATPSMQPRKKQKSAPSRC